MCEIEGYLNHSCIVCLGNIVIRNVVLCKRKNRKERRICDEEYEMIDGRVIGKKFWLVICV